jgi:hypothetical protein
MYLVEEVNSIVQDYLVVYHDGIILLVIKNQIKYQRYSNNFPVVGRGQERVYQGRIQDLF